MKTNTSVVNRISLGLLGLLVVSGQASAEWLVRDNQANKTLQSIDNRLKTSNDHLKQSEEYLRRLQRIGNAVTSYDETAKIPAERKLTQVAADYGIERCSKYASNPVAKDQLANCQEIVRTENAQYNYMVVMYDITDQRQTAFKTLVDQRKSIREDGKNGGHGLLQDNTNKLVALQTAMQIDQQRTLAAMNAFETRVRALNQRQATLTAEALAGEKKNSGGPDDIISGGLEAIGKKLVGGGVMLAALCAQQTKVSGNARGIDESKLCP